MLGREKLEPFAGFHLFPAKKPVDGVQRILQLPLRVRLLKPAEHRRPRLVRDVVTGRKKHRDALVSSRPSEVQPGSSAAEAEVAQHEIDSFGVQQSDGPFEIVDGRHDLIAKLGQHRFIVERGQRLILNDEDPLDDPLTLPEQHHAPKQDQFALNPKRTKGDPVPRRAPRNIPREEGPQRIAKLLARAGVASRRDIERMIADGRIALDGEALTTPATLLDNLRGVTVDGKPVQATEASRLFRFYKPQGTITAARDPKGRATIYDRLPAGLPRLMPVGRLDFTTEGLLLLTNDGELKRKLELPRTAVVRRYRARAFGHITQPDLDRLAEGITIEGVHYGSIIANLERRTGRNCWIELSLTEGKNREVRRVLAHLGLQVSRLIRTAYGPFTLAGLEPGRVDEIHRADLEAFRKTL